MTCIVGLESNGKVIIGGDSAGVSGYDVVIRRDPKVFRNGPFLIGYTSSFRMGQLLRFRLAVEEQHADVDDFEFMATVFVDAVRDCFGAYGFKRKEDDRDQGGTFMVGYKGLLYMVHDGFQVAMSANGFAACGCGESYALGALASTEAMTPTDRIKHALEIAERFSTGVRGPFVIEELSAA